MRPAVTVAPVERVAVDLARGQLLQPIQQPEAGQLTGLAAQTGGQRIRGRVADQLLQPLPGGDERSAAGSGRRREHPAHPIELRVEHVGPQVRQLEPGLHRGDLGAAPITALRMLGQVAVQHPRRGGPRRARAAPSAHRAQHAEPVGRDRRDLQIVGQLPEDLLGQAAEALLADTPTAPDRRHHHADVEVDPPADPAVADVRRDGGGRHRVGQEHLDHRPGRRGHHVRDGLAHIGVGPQEIAGAAVVPRDPDPVAPTVIGRACTTKSCSPTRHHSMSIGRPVQLLDPDPSSASRWACGRGQARPRSAGSAGTGCVGRAAAGEHGHDRLRVDHRGGSSGRSCASTVNAVRRHLAADHRLPQSPGGIDLDQCSSPVTGSAVNIIPDASASTSSCTTTAMASPSGVIRCCAPVGDRPGAVHSEAQQRRTASRS